MLFAKCRPNEQFKGLRILTPIYMNPETRVKRPTLSSAFSHWLGTWLEKDPLTHLGPANQMLSGPFLFYQFMALERQHQSQSRRPTPQQSKSRGAFKALRPRRRGRLLLGLRRVCCMDLCKYRDPENAATSHTAFLILTHRKAEGITFPRVRWEVGWLTCHTPHWTDDIRRWGIWEVPGHKRD